MRHRNHFPLPTQTAVIILLHCDFHLIKQQECILVWCIPPASVAMGGWFALGGCLPGGCLPKEGWSTSLFPLYAGIHPPHPPVDRMNNSRLWKHYLPATSFAGGKNQNAKTSYLLCYGSSFHWKRVSRQRNRAILRKPLQLLWSSGLDVWSR